MIKIVGIRFREGGQIFNFNPLDFQLNIGDAVIVDTQNGLELGFVAFMPRFIPEDLLKFPLRDVIRFADDDDLNIRARQEEREAEACEIALELIEKHELEMQLISAQELSYDDKLVFYFTADGRVDFRALVKDLANVFRKRIELRQIGVRDEARRTGGIGRCGRVLCCASFLKDFGSVSVKMAKNQNLSMNPSKISGVCGRLLCCLKYEDDAYTDARERAPELNSIVNTIYGKGEVKSVDLLKETFTIERSNKDGELETIKLSFEDRLDEFGNKIDFSKRTCSCQSCHNKVSESEEESNPLDVAKKRVNEWIVNQAGDSVSKPRYDHDSEFILESLDEEIVGVDESAKADLENDLFANTFIGQETQIDSSNMTNEKVSREDFPSENVHENTNQKNDRQSQYKTQRRKNTRTNRRKHFSPKKRMR